MSNKSSSRVSHQNSMDIDNFMSDPAQPFTASASQDQAAETHNSGPAVWDAKVYREEVANIKPRLADQKFKTSDYADPFKPHPAARNAPNSEAEADVQRWQSIIDKVLEKA